MKILNAKNLSKDEYDEFVPDLQLFTLEHARRYASLELPGLTRPLALSWRSDVIKPSVQVDGANDVI